MYLSHRLIAEFRLTRTRLRDPELAPRIAAPSLTQANELFTQKQGSGGQWKSPGGTIAPICSCGKSVKSESAFPRGTEDK